MRRRDAPIQFKVKVWFAMTVELFVPAKLFKSMAVAQKMILFPANHSTNQNVTNQHRAVQFTNIASHAVFSQIIRIHWQNLSWVPLYPWNVYSAQSKINFNSASQSAVLLRYQEPIPKNFKKKIFRLKNSRSKKFLIFFFWNLKKVQHGNTYRDPKFKYCYGSDPPRLRFA